MIKKEDLKKYITEAIDKSMKGTLNQLDLIQENVLAISNHRGDDSFDIKGSMKEILENLNKNLNAIGSVKSEVKDAISSITTSVDVYKGLISKKILNIKYSFIIDCVVQNGKDSRDRMNEIKNLLDSICSNMKVDNEVKKKILLQVDTINTTLTKVSEKVEFIQYMNLEKFGKSQ